MTQTVQQVAGENPTLGLTAPGMVIKHLKSAKVAYFPQMGK